MAGREVRAGLPDQARAEQEGLPAEREAAARAEADRQAAEAEAKRREQERSAAAEREAQARAEAERRAAEAKAEAERQERERQEAERQRALTRRAQLALAALGFDIGQADGVQGRRTADALATYRKRARLPAEPELSEAFVAGLEADAAALRQQRLAESLAREKAEAEKRAEAARVAEETKRQAEAAKRAEAEKAAGEVAERQAAEARRLAEEEAEAERLAAAAVATPPAEQAREGAKPTAKAPSPPSAPAAPTPPDGTRVALVIGNGAYRAGGLPPLPNPANDAADVAAALERVGFRVFKGTDLGRLEMEDLAVEFARAADRADVAVTFYAGHGLQVGGRNYLVPVDAKVEDDRDLRRLIAADSLVDDASNARKLAVVMLDACRDNPISRSLERGLTRSSVGRGLARPSRVPAQTLIAYATAEGATAADGAERNSPFTAAFLRHLAEPGLEVRLLFGKVRDSVVAATGGGQRPNIYGDLGGDPIFLVPKAPEPQDQEPAMALAERKALQRALGALRFYQGPEDGALSFQVRAAVRDFQRSLGAPATGYVTVGQLVEAHQRARAAWPPSELPGDLNVIEVLRGSEAGDAGAQRLRGMLHDTTYDLGGLPKDDGEAARWYRKAADAGRADAALELGDMLRDGRGVARDPAEAARRLRTAAEAGLGGARLLLAEVLLETGDQAEAVRLLRQAAGEELGGPEAMARLRLLGAWEEGEAAPVAASR